MTISDIENDLRYIQFRVGNQMRNLDDDYGRQKLMPRLLAWSIINRSIVEVQADLNEQAQIKHTNCILNSDVLAAPTDMLAVQRILIYPDDNSANSSTAESSYETSEGKELVQVFSHTALQVGVGAVEEIFTDVSSGKPRTFSLWQQEDSGTQVVYFQWNVKADLRYFLDVFYYVSPAALTASTESPSLSSPFHDLIVARAASKVAVRLGDRAQVATFLEEYAMIKRALRPVVERRRTPGRVVFQEFP